MFERLLKDQHALARHRNGSLAEVDQSEARNAKSRNAVGVSDLSTLGI